MENTNTQQESPVLTWNAPAKPNYERSPRWYAIAGVLTILAVSVSLILGAWTAALAFLLAAGGYFLVRNEKHLEHEIGISERGLHIDGGLHPWEQWDSFWILQGKTYAELHIKPKKGRKEFVVLTGNVNPIVIRDALGQFLQQNPEGHEKLFDIILRICKL